MKTLNITFTAGQRIPLNLVGDYLHLLETTAGIDIDFLRNGAVIGTASNMEYGFFSKPAGGFDGLAFTSATIQTIKIAVGIGEGGYNRTTGAVSITGTVPVSGAFWQSVQPVSLQGVQPVSLPASAKVGNAGTEFSASYKSVTNLLANTPVTILAPGSNVNGVLLAAGFMISGNSSAGLQNFVAKTSSPTSVIDGHPLLAPVFAFGATSFVAVLQNPIIVPAGLGIYAIAAVADAGTNNYKSLLYTVL